jgi:tetratricopeptide (TPR) repeat protein
LVAGCGSDPKKVWEEAEAAREMSLHQAALDRYLELQDAGVDQFPELTERIGDCYAALSKPSDALAAWQAALKANETAKLWNKLGAFLVQAGRKDEGMAALHKAIQLDPKAFDAFLNLGVLELQARRYGEALSALGKAAELAPENATVLKTLGVAFVQVGRAREGAALIHQAWRRDRSAMAAPQLFQLLESHEMWAEAAEVGEVAVADSSDPAVLIDYADALIRSGQGAKGSRIYRALESMDLPPELKARVKRVMDASRKLAAQVQAARDAGPGADTREAAGGIEGGTSEPAP